MTPLARTLVAIVSAEPNEWTVATLAEDLDVSQQAVRLALKRAERAGYNLKLGLSETARLLNSIDLSQYTEARLAQHLRLPPARVKSALAELRDTGLPAKTKRKRVATMARVLQLHEAYPGPHTLQWYATHCPATVHNVASCLRALAARGMAPPIDPGDTRRTELRADRIELARGLRRYGATYAEIGAALGVSVATVAEYVRNVQPTRRRRAA